MKKRYIFLTLTLCFFGVINTYAQVPSYVPTSGLVSFWPFNGNGNDASSNNNHLTAVGPTLTSDSCGSSNKAYTFSSLNDYMYPTKSYSATNVLTYSIWIKSNSTVGSNSTYSGQVIHFNNGRITHGGMWCKTLWVNTSGVTFYTYQSGQVTHTVNANILDNNWHHIVVTMDGNGSKIYIDGTYRSTKTSQNSGQVFTGYYRIGGLANTSTLARSLIGDYDDIGIWSRVLSASEIAGLYTANCCTTTYSTDTITSCGPYTWTDGVTYTSSNNTAKDTFVNAAGCDSIVTLNLTVLYETRGSMTLTECDAYTSSTGKTWNESGTYLDTLSNREGCDSLVTYDLTIINSDDIISQDPTDKNISPGNDVTFTVVSLFAPNATYQWQRDNGTGFQNLSNVGQYSGTSTDILTITNISTSNVNEVYRCIVTANSCTDTSGNAVLTIDRLSVPNLFVFEDFSVYPNPSNGIVSIESKSSLFGSSYKVYSIKGIELLSGSITRKITTLNIQDLAEGVYLIRVGNDAKQTCKIIKQ